ncbi:SNF2 domain-containing protein CLASSY [Ancistrocladus abbreviatus]
MKKGALCRQQHPFEGHPFEVLYRSSWQTVEQIRISNGAIAFRLAGIGYVFEEKGLLSSLQLRPRKASLSDCTLFLRPGVDVRVLHTSQHSGNSCEEAEPVWIDGQIGSLERKPHESQCTCKFFVKYNNADVKVQTNIRKPKKEVKVVGIDEISIFQKLEKKPSEGTHYRWSFAEDCTSMQKTKLFLGKFSSDLSWMVVASVQKHNVFDVISMQHKIVYQILDGNFDSCSSDVHLSGLNFKMDNDLSVPIVIPFVAIDIGAASEQDVDEVSPLSSYDPETVQLRRSSRRFVQPERYLGDIGLEEVDTTSLRIGYKSLKMNEEEMSLVLLDEADIQGNLLEGGEDGIRDFDGFLVSRVGVQLQEGKSGVDNQNKNQANLAIIPLPHEQKKMVRGRHKQRNQKACEQHREGNQMACKLPHERNQKARQTSRERAQMDHEQSDLLAEMLGSGFGDDVPLKYYRKRRREVKVRSKKPSEFDSLEDETKWYWADSKGESRWEEKYSNKKPRGRMYRPVTTSRTVRDSEVGSSKKKTLDAGAYKELITAYMRRIQATIENKQPETGDPWRQILEEKVMNKKEVDDEAAAKEHEDEDSETEMLWREMDLCLASLYLLEENENPNGNISAEQVPKSFGRGQLCHHEFKLDDEVGLLCPLCGYVLTEIRDVSPPFLQTTGGGVMKHERTRKDDLEHKLIDEVGMDFVSAPASAETLSSESNENVWALIPDLRKKLHIHQKKAFEFLWQNIAGSLLPSEMNPSGKKIGGCVISHAPGAGKTFLIIAFLLSYLKLFPGKRPLVLAPKTTLYTWYKEIIKWEFPVPVYQIHGRRTYRDRIYIRKMEGSSCANMVPSGDVMHILDCLEKLQKWHAHPSVLLMGYTSFMTLMREDSKYAYRRYMGKILRESPGILILDEGHNPRSTKSRLRKALMRIETDIRILLSGTLFQNNFGEYFNTLCLARPKFVNEVLRKLDPKYERKKNGVKKTRTTIENRARKVFVDIIAWKINSSVAEERMEGLNILKNMTNQFIDVYEGGSSENLPGLQSYTLMMKPTPMQNEILVKLHKFMNLCRGFPLELELMITLGSIHPWLIKTAVCANKFLTADELQSLDEHKLDPTKGSKVKFVLGLVHRSIIRREKVLIFCHNIAPINLFLELFQRIYGWRKGEEVLVLQGDLELFERGRVMDRFEERGGPSKVMLASINACAEGISLTAASRVILLDSEWNPSKQKQAIARAFRPGQEKIVYVYQLLASGTLEEDKYRRTTWKEWVSCMIFSEELVEDPSRWQAERIEDALLREIVEEDHAKLFHMIMKNEKASYENPLARVNE